MLLYLLSLEIRSFSGEFNEAKTRAAEIDVKYWFCNVSANS